MTIGIEAAMKLRNLAFDPSLGVYDCFARVRDIVPDAVAIVSDERHLSYLELGQVAERLARNLVAKGVHQGDRVAIVASRSIEAVVAMLAVLRAGGAFVPLDPTYAAEQLEFMVKDVDPRLVMFDEKYGDLAMTLAGPHIPVLGIQAGQEKASFRADDLPRSRGQDLGYVMYTSGSTGRPKGVMIAQKGITRIAFDQPVGQLFPGDVMLHSSTIACDGSTEEIWAPLFTGGTVAIVSEPKPSLDALVSAIKRHKVNVSLFYAGVFHLLVEKHLEALSGFRMIFAAGDVLSPTQARKVMEAYPGLKLCNMYGPTENTVYSTLHHLVPGDLGGAPIPIGPPAAHGECFVLDETMVEVGSGEAGQLAVTGDGLGLGYLNLPEQSAERFVEDPRPGRTGKIYLTGDLVRRRDDGIYEFLGRLDRQVKIGGRRIELDEIEHALRALPQIEDAAVAVVKPVTGDKRIASFLKPAKGIDQDDATFIQGVKDALRATMPEGMLPRQNYVMRELPLTANNKVDRKALVNWAESLVEESAPAKAPTKLADVRAVGRIVAEVWNEILRCGEILPDQSFFDAGGTSLQLIGAHAELERRLGTKFDITVLFETPRLRDLSSYLATLVVATPATEPAKEIETAVPAAKAQIPSNAIAIVGIAGRFPGVDSVAEFWQQIRGGTNLIPRFSADEIEDSFSPSERAAPNYVAARPFLKDADKFDAKFFSMYPREAAVADPQGRVFLEVCYEALEDAGIPALPENGADKVGVFAGCSMSTYMLNNVLGDRSATNDFTSNYQIGNYAELTGNLTDSLATRVAYKLNLSGPALTVHTACSTSLTAISIACLNLRSGQCDTAIAGGVSITFPQKRGYFAQEGGMASEDGVCRPFDAQAGGTVFGHGAGAVVLRRLEDAVADGDHIYAVIRGFGINNDGADKISYTAPSVKGQAGAIRAAHKDAGVSADSISYVECHGTATPLGDPIEIRALVQAFGESEATGTCALGSVKGNIGHLDAAAGVMGIIKTALMLHHREIPKVANFKSLNPRIDLGKSPFYVPEGTAPWASIGPRRAGVSAFGVGGTNVHFVLEEAPPVVTGPEIASPQILPLSAKTPEALSEAQARLADALEATDGPALADVALTLQEGRRVYEFRNAFACQTKAEAAAELRKTAAPKTATSGEAPPVVFLFPGQGSQYPGMGSGLYASEPEFARHIDLGAEILEPLLGLDINKLLCFGDPSDSDAARALRDTRLTQPALFLIQYANAKLWESRGIVPTAMIGHSVGEFAAATLSGVMDFETGLRIIAERGRLMQSQPGGAMLSVRGTFDEISPFLSGDVDIAARNGPKLIVLSGTFEAIAAAEARLKAAQIPCSTLHTSHAFHSRMMDPVSDALEQMIARARLNPIGIPYVSCVTGTWATDAEARDPAYWARQARAAVNFEAAVTAVCEGQPPVLLEIGAGTTLSTFASQTLPRGAAARIIQSLPDHARAVSDEMSMAGAMAKLWSAGVPVEWSKSGPRGKQRVSLPTYPFQRKRHWIDAPALPQGVVSISTEQIVPESNVAPLSIASEDPVLTQPTMASSADRSARLVTEVLALLSDLSGETVSAEDAGASFLELGYDSLFLGQVAQRITSDYSIDLTFRQLLSDVPSPDALAAYLNSVLPPDPVETPAQPAPIAQAPAPAIPTAPAATAAAVSQPVTAQAALPLPKPALPVAAIGGGLESVLHAQMATMQAIFAQQLQSISGVVPAAAPVTQPPAISSAVAKEPAANARPAPVVAATADTEEPAPTKKPAFSIGRSGNASGGDLTAEQLAFVKELARRYSARSPKSKAYTQQHRSTLADPRTVAGFRAEWKEMVFPVVAERSKGSRIWDIDGNEYVDLVNGFGQTAFGHSPDFVINAVNRQMEKGFAIGPQSDLAGPVAERFARMVGHERVTFCNTGSEAVMAAMRLARAVTGRERIVVFSNDYHGQFDEVLVKGKSRGGPPAALPIAPGIPRTGLVNMTVLSYGADESLDWIRANGSDIAGVIVEPIQSRHPEVRPREFVRTLRDITRDIGAAMIMDEVVTGFRVGPRGMQGEWDVQADMATYGKVVGGGMPIGILAGCRRFMDALDGGQWGFGDESSPETAPTFFAGTFVRHPLVVAAVDATLDHIEKHGPDLWDRVAKRTQKLVEDLNEILRVRGLPRLVEGYSSWLVLNLTNHDPNATLIFPLMRMAGVHVQVGYMCMFTTTHSEADFQLVAKAFEEGVDQLRSVGILGSAVQPLAAPATAAQTSAPRPTTGIPLTEAQREIWMTNQLGDTAACSFNESAAMRISGRIDSTVLGQALDRVIARHDGLRQKFSRTGETFDILEPFSIDLPELDLDQAGFEEIVREDAAMPIDIVEGPALRAFLVHLGPEDHVLVINAHHIICDGWSYNVIFDDLSRIYRELTGGAPAKLDAAPSFAAFALERSKSSASEKTVDFWRNLYSSVPDLPELPTDHPRPVVKTFNGSTVTAYVDGTVLSAVKKAGAKQGCTLFATLFGALQIVMGRLSGSDDIVLGVPNAGQAALDENRLVGHCVNFLPLRAPMNPSGSVASHLKLVRDAVMNAFEHQDITYGTLVQKLEIERSLNRLPLTEIQFNLERTAESLDLNGATATVGPNPKTAANFDLFFNVIERKDGLRVDVDYNADIFDATTVQRWVGHLERALESMSRDMEQAVADLSILKPDETKWLVETLNQTKSQLPPSQLIQDMVTRWVAETPDAIAVDDGNRKLSYAQLAARSDAIAAHLQKLKPSGAGRVAVYMNRSVECLAALLGVLISGNAYVPLDPAQPDARMRSIVEAARAGILLHDGTTAPAFAEDLNIASVPTGTIADGGKPALVLHDGSTSAYVMFTSGSTGTPKGVEIPHRAVINLLQSVAKKPGFSVNDKLLAVTTIMFDISVLELFLPISCGGTTVIAATDDVLDGFKLARRIALGDITHVQATPTLWSMLLEAGLKPKAPMKLLAGGEPLPADLAGKLMESGCELWNMYGPTETTIWSAVSRVVAGERITIGHPTDNTELHVLGPNLGILPIGAVGELNIGGAGLAKGYFDRPDLTEAAFRNVSIDGVPRRLYRTGDNARRLADGTIEVLGRADGQIKLRGFRIELGEVETVLRSLAGVQKAAVALKHGARGDQLVAYIVTDPAAEPSYAELATRMSALLPKYMVPTAWVTLSSLPQTANGKLDRKALPAPEATATVSELHVGAKTPMEIKLANIWESVLGRETISTTQSLYELGADSLTVFRIAARMIDQGLNLEARDLLKHPTIARLAEFAATRDSQGDQPVRPSLKSFRNGARRGAAE